MPSTLDPAVKTEVLATLDEIRKVVLNAVSRTGRTRPCETLVAWARKA